MKLRIIFVLAFIVLLVSAAMQEITHTQAASSERTSIQMPSREQSHSAQQSNRLGQLLSGESRRMETDEIELKLNPSLEQNLAPQSGTLSNLRLNDPAQESGSRVQNGTASAVSGQNIVVAFNDIGTELSAVSYSNDGGQSWSTTHVPQFPGGRNFGSGVVAAAGGDTFYYAGLALNNASNSIVILSRSTDGGRSWSTPTLVFAQNSSAQDKPWIAVDSTGGPKNGTLYVSWTEFRFSGNPAGSRVICAASSDGGSTFPFVIALSNLDNTFSVQGSNIAIGPAGEVNVTWGDLRISGIRFVRSINGGQTYTRPVNAAVLNSYDLVGPILNGHFDTNGLPSIAADRSTGPNRGALYIVFSAPSPVRAMDQAEVFLVRSTDGGVNWSMPARVNDDVGNTDQFLPSVAVATDGSVGVMWYDRRDDPLHNGLLEVYGTLSKDGTTFGAARRISTAAWLPLTTPLDIRSNYHGDYNQMSALTDRPGFFINWGDDRSGLDADVYGAVVETSIFTEDLSDLIISPLVTSQTVIAGQGATLRLKIRRTGNSSDPVSYSAASDSGDISLDVDTRGVRSDEISVLARTKVSTAVGTHPVVVRATAGSLTTTITLRLNVLAQSPLSRRPLNASNTTGRSVDPHLTTDRSGVVNMVWSDTLNRSFRINYSRSVDGTNFSRPIEISKITASGTNPQVAVDASGTVHVTWQECVNDASGTLKCDTVYSRSTDQGATFSPSRSLSPGFQFSELPSITTTPKGDVLIFWDATRNFSSGRFDVFAALSTDGGANFSQPIIIAGGEGRNLFTTAATSDDAGRSYVAYESCAAGNCRIEVKRSTDGFASSSAAAIASEGVDFAIQPAIAALANGEVYIAMTTAIADGDPRFEISTSASFDNGTKFTRVQNISNTPQASLRPAIVADDKQVSVAWLDRSPGNPEIFFAQSTNKGMSYSTPVNLTTNSSISNTPSLAIDPAGSLLMSFEDDMEGNEEAYYIRLSGPAKAGAISSIDPNNGPPGTLVTIRGSELTSVNSVSIGGRQAEFFLGSPSDLSLIIPPGSQTGPISIETPGGNASSPGNFTVTSAISAGPARLDFGLIVTGQEIDPETVAIRNSGSAPLKVTGLSFSNPEFRLASPLALPAQIAPGGILRLGVRFFPSAAGDAQSTLKIDSDDKLTPSVSLLLVGRATAPVLTLLAPRGGEKVKSGGNFFIQWQVDGAEFTSFDLVLSTDGGQTFKNPIANGLGPQSRNFTWTVPSLKTKTARVAIIARTPNGTVFMDQSKANFKIKKK